MTFQLPDPLTVAQQEVEKIKADPELALNVPMNRALRDCPMVDRESALISLEQFHQERMQRMPSAAKFPEAQTWAQHAVAVDKHVQELANLTDLQMAALRSLHEYLQWRGIPNATAVSSEKCRVAYVPETDRGQLHIKNVDDPITHWKRITEPVTAMQHADELVWDGTGSGLHIDDEPEEIFPLPIPAMCKVYCNDVPSAVEFLRRYTSFWGRQNVVLHDRQKRSVAIEKCSFNHMEVFEPGPNGESHISGMVCRDPDSPQGRHQQEKRMQYVRQFGLPEDGSDMVFWARCFDAEVKLADALNKPGPLKSAELIELFTTPYSQGGLNKDGVKTHPDQPVAEYTHVTRIAFIDERLFLRYQRNDDGSVYDAEPERYDFSNN